MNVCAQNDEMESLQVVKVTQFLPSSQFLSKGTTQPCLEIMVFWSPPLVPPWAFFCKAMAQTITGHHISVTDASPAFLGIEKPRESTLVSPLHFTIILTKPWV